MLIAVFFFSRNTGLEVEIVARLESPALLVHREHTGSYSRATVRSLISRQPRSPPTSQPPPLVASLLHFHPIMDPSQNQQQGQQQQARPVYDTSHGGHYGKLHDQASTSCDQPERS